jgi:hypothetical protein
MPKDIQIYKVKDPAEKFYVDKGKMFDLPMRLLVSGKSYLAGKTNLLTNLLLQDDKRLYRNNFKGDNIYIFTSHSHDNKIKLIVDEMEIPACNMMYGDFDNDLLDALLDNIEEEFEEEKKHSLIILDDMSFGGGLKSKTNGAIAKLFCNGRHFGCSVILTCQRYCDLPTTCRENATGAILFRCPERVLETIVADHNYMDKKDFISLFRKLSNAEKHSFMCVNYSNDAKEMYMNNHFQPVGKCGKPIGGGCSCYPELKEK